MTEGIGVKPWSVMEGGRVHPRGLHASQACLLGGPGSGDAREQRAHPAPGCHGSVCCPAEGLGCSVLRSPRGAEGSASLLGSRLDGGQHVTQRSPGFLADSCFTTRPLLSRAEEPSVAIFFQVTEPHSGSLGLGLPRAFRGAKHELLTSAAWVWWAVLPRRPLAPQQKGGGRHLGSCHSEERILDPEFPLWWLVLEALGPSSWMVSSPCCAPARGQGDSGTGDWVRRDAR